VTTARGLSPLAVIDAWLEAGVQLIQVRGKTLSTRALLDIARQVAGRGSSAGATIFVNDRADVARLSGASGVHVGQEDLRPADVRAVVGTDMLVGVSTHSIDQLEEALVAPVDYVAVGPVFATATKGSAVDPVVGLEFVRQAAARAQAAGRPLIAIGGITVENAAVVIEAGADAVAVISDLLTGDPGTRARAFGEALVRSKR